ncbi:FAD-dependent monooxygenase [Thiomicrorhabdus indica]|uniref:FAD-dependent monooxygenase n=1 Tax=Thiomicrorhabdus indica TaxID=2267253 RepID=UPI002AA6D554|nr:FAD-dependent monooxygenase [Thiomicrorhabdus indica]
MKTLSCDFLISGAGPVGLILAIGLSRKGYEVIVAEQFTPNFPNKIEQQENAFDGRVLALSQGSADVLREFGIWPSLLPLSTPIKKVHVSQKGYLGLTTISNEELGIDALGYSVQGWDLGNQLWKIAERQENIQLLSPVEFKQFSQFCELDNVSNESANEFAVLSVLKETESNLSIEVRSHCLIGADGTDSQVRKGLGFELHTKSYEAFGVLARIEAKDAHHGLAFERFTPQGPMALLPMAERFHKAVWVCSVEDKARILDMDDQAFMQAFSERMGERFGGFVSVSKRLAYPLKETSLDQISEGCVVLMGNAAHTQHPVAAQGLNLGIKDVFEFVAALDRFGNQFNRPVDLSNPTILSELISDYASRQQKQHEKVMGMTDGLIQIFEHPSPIVGHARGLGLAAMQLLPPLKKRFARFAMGKA